jgi:hypothetical protein
MIYLQNMIVKLLHSRDFRFLDSCTHMSMDATHRDRVQHPLQAVQPQTRKSFKNPKPDGLTPRPESTGVDPTSRVMIWGP